jgi:hypothetical protein
MVLRGSLPRMTHIGKYHDFIQTSSPQLNETPSRFFKSAEEVKNKTNAAVFCRISR